MYASGIQSIILNATYSAGFSDPVLQWQTSVLIPQEPGMIYRGANTQPIDSGEGIRVLYLPHSIEKEWILIRRAAGSLPIRIWTMFILCPYKLTRDMIGCLGKDLVLSDPRMFYIILDLSERYQTDSRCRNHNVQYSDTGCTKLFWQMNSIVLPRIHLILRFTPAPLSRYKQIIQFAEGKAIQLSASGDELIYGHHRRIIQ